MVEEAASVGKNPLGIQYLKRKLKQEEPVSADALNEARRSLGNLPTEQRRTDRKSTSPNRGQLINLLA